VSRRRQPGVAHHPVGRAAGRGRCSGPGRGGTERTADASGPGAAAGADAFDAADAVFALLDADQDRHDRKS
jgi:hypothetical protein